LKGEGIINTEKLAIRIYKNDLNTSLNIPILCHQYKKTKCLNGKKVMEVQERKKFIWNKTRAEYSTPGATQVVK
jgi:hypothetical protein